MKHSFQKRIEENRRAGMDGAEAVRQAKAADPEGWKDYVESTNQDHRRPVDLPDWQNR
jgi:hypothetical protein